MRKNINALAVTAALIICAGNVFPAAKKSAAATGDWLDPAVPSFYEAYKSYFDYAGFAVEYGNFGANWGTKKELYYDAVQKGLARHANTISLGNEFKPQFIMAWWGSNPSVTGSFKASNGLTIKTPALNGISRIDDILAICKKNGLKMRGHVLLWHSQTEDAFFCRDYDKSKELVSPEEMDARLEWYIKTVLERVSDWERKNNGGRHIVWAWDVINEVTADGSQADAATSSDYTHWLRTSGSKWYEVYKSPDFIIRAFQYANKYAPSDVKLCYNDYGGLSGAATGNKHKSQLRVAELILAHKNDALPARLDAMGLQSHYSIKNSAAAVEREIQDFVARGLDVQITELDIGTWDNYDTQRDVVGATGRQFNSLADAYKAFFEVYIRNRRTSDRHGVDSVTVWGLNDEDTWLNSDGQKRWLGNCEQYPLLFTKPDKTKWIYIPKPAFYAVIEAAK